MNGGAASNTGVDTRARLVRQTRLGRAGISFVPFLALAALFVGCVPRYVYPEQRWPVLADRVSLDVPEGEVALIRTALASEPEWQRATIDRAQFPTWYWIAGPTLVDLHAVSLNAPAYFGPLRRAMRRGIDARRWPEPGGAIFGQGGGRDVMPSRPAYYAGGRRALLIVRWHPRPTFPDYTFFELLALERVKGAGEWRVTERIEIDRGHAAGYFPAPLPLE